MLCGRATWRGATDHFSEGEDAVVEWFRTEGKANIESLNKVLDETANPVK